MPTKKLTEASRRQMPLKVKEREGSSRAEQAAWHKARGSGSGAAAADAAVAAVRQEREARSSDPFFVTVVAFKDAAAAEEWEQRLRLQILLALPPITSPTGLAAQRKLAADCASTTAQPTGRD